MKNNGNKMLFYSFYLILGCRVNDSEEIKLNIE